MHASAAKFLIGLASMLESLEQCSCLSQESVAKKFSSSVQPFLETLRKDLQAWKDSPVSDEDTCPAVLQSAGLDKAEVERFLKCVAERETQMRKQEVAGKMEGLAKATSVAAAFMAKVPLAKENEKKFFAFMRQNAKEFGDLQAELAKQVKVMSAASPFAAPCPPSKGDTRMLPSRFQPCLYVDLLLLTQTVRSLRKSLSLNL